MANIFEDKNGRYFVLVNEEGQHSMWPTVVDVPAGWSIIFGDATRDDCLKYIESNWTDLRPRSLVNLMNGSV